MPMEVEESERPSQDANASSCRWVEVGVDGDVNIDDHGLSAYAMDGTGNMVGSPVMTAGAHSFVVTATLSDKNDDFEVGLIDAAIDVREDDLIEAKEKPGVFLIPLKKEEFVQGFSRAGLRVEVIVDFRGERTASFSVNGRTANLVDGACRRPLPAAVRPYVELWANSGHVSATISEYHSFGSDSPR